VIFYFVLLTELGVSLLTLNIFFCPAVLGVFTKCQKTTRPLTQQGLHFVILQEKNIFEPSKVYRNAALLFAVIAILALGKGEFTRKLAQSYSGHQVLANVRLSFNSR